MKISWQVQQHIDRTRSWLFFQNNMVWFKTNGKSFDRNCTIVGLVSGFLFLCMVRNISPRFKYMHLSIKPEDDKFWQTLRTYIKARNQGLSQINITTRIFNVTNLHEISGHPHSYPFLTGDTLKSFADIYYDRSKNKGHPSASFYLVDGIWILKGDRNVPLKKRKHVPTNGDVIFIKTDFLERIAGTFLTQLNTTFILITHNSAFSVPRGSKSMKILDHPKLIRWFAQNPRIRHPKLEAIPIGLENQVFNYAGYLPTLEKSLKFISRIYDPADKDTHRTKPNTLYMNFNLAHNKIRPVTQHHLIKMGHQKSETKSLLEYHRDLARSRFVVSPPGVGEDCHRTWEAILFGTIPIVWNSTLWTLFRQSPVRVAKYVNDFEYDNLNDFQVHSKNRQLLMAQYWFDRINSFR